MVSWAIELSEFDITYEARHAIKSQALADFVMELTPVEYEALIAGLLQAKESGARRVHVSTNSQLVASQINGAYQAKGPLMIKYLGKVKEIITEFDEEPTFVMVISETNDWRKPIADCLERGILPDEPLDAKKLMKTEASYTLVNDQLYQKGLQSPMMKCLAASEAHYVLMEIHEGINGHHKGTKALARKVVRAGYFWPTMAADSKDHVQRCDSCQKHANTIRSPPATLQVISAPWPFFKWGMDLLGPFKRAARQLRWLIVAVDYFTKWIEVEPVATITSGRVQKFLQKNIISRFGIPAEIVTDNRTQFIDKGFRKLVADFNIQQHFASVEHPQSNRQAEAANKVIVDGLKTRMEDATSSWVDQLPYVLWGYRTSVQSSTGEMPFKLTYGCEAMIPVEIGESSWRRVTTLQNEEENSNAIVVELDLIDEVRIAAHCRDLAAKQLISTRYNKKVRPWYFDKGSLVLRRVDIGNKNATEGKLAPNWEGPYRVTENLVKGAYKLEKLQKKAVKRTWNADKLKAYYS
ncbi:hypothetical protein K1719_034306 [Acacia pycnantha]|nr:hypothetical protein K1719_034306 [Acacia pycnantha]